MQPSGLHSPWNSPGQNTGVSSLSLLQGIFPTHGSNSDLPHCRRILYQLSHKGSPRILEWGAMPSSKGYSQPRSSPYRWILYHLSHQGSPRILEWVTYPFSRESPQSRNRTRVSKFDMYNLGIAVLFRTVRFYLEISKKGPYT